MTEQQIIETLATKVMGWEKRDLQELDYWYHDGKVICRRGNWNPLQNKADAWMIVKKLEQEFDAVCLMKEGEEWRFYVGRYDADEYEATAPTAQEAICNVAIKAVEATE
ncbi:hypothetical protein G3578_09805 [Brevibacillus sp. SYP-B805]|uniref:BC1872 family protein n=1 Tax=Brevibacillus sp. SYP-B805 TaxID=1578199 RepID=UPI0013EE3B3B|nr:hypothetical protein [Brevibacillus sp. SYP-B805]NGQ95447.1 hypothetical protein [Brevibacillus sp. SYP-B805]